MLKPLRDDLACILPMAVFLLFTWAGGQWPALYPISYVLKTLTVPIILYFLWPHFSKIRWTHLPLGVLVGILGVIQWIGMEKLLLHYLPNYPRLSAEAFDPTVAFSSPALMICFIAVRWAGSSLLVPVMEELFWRDFVWRTILAPNNFKLAEVGESDPKPFLIVPLIFATVHIQWLTAIVWGLLIGLLLIRTKSLGACIIAHAVTNFLLGAYVLYAREWFFW